MNKNARKLLQRIARRFQTQHHGLVSQLDAFQISIVELADFSKEGMARSLSEKPSLEDTLIDLQARGYLKSADSLSVSLTELGLDKKRGDRFNLRMSRLSEINLSPLIGPLIAARRRLASHEPRRSAARE
jgi:hypothetical protein